MSNGLRSAKYWRAVREYERQDREREAAMPRTKEQTPEEWIAETNEAMQLAAERQAVDSLLPYWECQQAEKHYRESKEAHGLVIKTYLQTHDMTELEDSERGVKAVLQTRKLSTENWDIASMPDELILRLAKAGCLLADKKAMDLKGHQALRIDAEPYFIPAGETVALRVNKE